MSTGDNYLKWKQRAEQAELLAEQRKGGISQLTAQLNEAVARAEQAESECSRLAAEVLTVRDAHLKTMGEREEARGWFADIAEVLLGERPTGVMPSTTRQAALDLKARAELAEADNAALLEAYRRTWGCVMHDNVVHSPACNGSNDALGICTPECPALRVSSLLKADHPGAALLERLRVATAYAATGLREHHGHRCGMAGGPYPESAAECEDAHCRQWAHDLDALKEGKP